MSESAKSERLNLRVSPEALQTIRKAAHAQQQDVTSFVLGAALDRARAVLTEVAVMRLTPRQAVQLERELDREAEPIPQLAALVRKVRAGAGQ